MVNIVCVWPGLAVVVVCGQMAEHIRCRDMSFRGLGTDLYFQQRWFLLPLKDWCVLNFQNFQKETDIIFLNSKNMLCCVNTELKSAHFSIFFTFVLWSFLKDLNFCFISVIWHNSIWQETFTLAKDGYSHHHLDDYSPRLFPMRASGFGILNQELALLNNDCLEVMRPRSHIRIWRKSTSSRKEQGQNMNVNFIKIHYLDTIL